MGDTSENKTIKHKKRICAGLLAHVDAGKTTLSESMLYAAGAIRKMGRVDKGDAFLDTHELEKERGITIFSKQAVLELGDKRITLLDTPGHVDFSAEMERTLQALDYAVLVISGADGVQGHTLTLWKLLGKYGVPAFLFINKMDQEGNDKDKLLLQVQRELDDGCVCFSDGMTDEFYENIAMCDEAVMENYLENGAVEESEISRLIRERRLFPCYFGSALRNDGVQEFMDGLQRYTEMPSYPKEFGARVFKIVRDEQGNRLTYLKITGGTLKVRDILKKEDAWEEKVNQIRIYSGEKYEAVPEVYAGDICAVTGLSVTRPGEGLGVEAGASAPVLEPVLTYRIILPDGVDAAMVLPKFRLLEEEEPELHIVWNETLKEIQVQIMGEVQLEILKRLIKERFGMDVSFDAGSIVYKETIANVVEGVGHFEPLRHYAEVHLLLEPGERGSGMQFLTDCSEDILDKNWQRLILTHLMERRHKGVLTGAELTDAKITLKSGRAHPKHTEGGDFRQATYRAVRQGLMQAESVLLEPWYDFRLEVPETMIGRAMTDIEQRHGTMDPPDRNGEMAVLTGSAPVSAMRGYSLEVAAYTRGRGHIFCTLKGYDICHDAARVVKEKGYDPELDFWNPSDSVFCSHGSGISVRWDQVTRYMHLESILTAKKKTPGGLETGRLVMREAPTEEEWIDSEEVDRILDQTFNANRREKTDMKRGLKKKKSAEPVYRTFGKAKEQEKQKEYLLVDGYNVIYAWEDLTELAKVNLAGARGKLLDILCNYQASRGCELIAVFDAYRVKGHETEYYDYHNIHVVFTKEAETADQYIEKFAHENSRKYHVTVATSDGVEQVIIMGQGCELISSRELRENIKIADQKMKEAYPVQMEGNKTYLLDSFSLKEKEKLADGNADKASKIMN